MNADYFTLLLGIVATASGTTSCQVRFDCVAAEENVDILDEGNGLTYFKSCMGLPGAQQF